jgi:very-short-patch-repair endonuclease
MAHLVEMAKNLRKQQTFVENILWRRLKSRQIEGTKFRRQQPIGNFIVDFVSFEKSLIIELDGGQHAIEKDKDQRRDQFLSERGFEVLRFWNNDVIENIDGVMETIRLRCLCHPPLAPPVKGGEFCEEEGEVRARKVRRLRDGKR